MCEILQNDYEIQEQIGRGGFATVYKGTRKSDGAVVAIKKIIVSAGFYFYINTDFRKD